MSNSWRALLTILPTHKETCCQTAVLPCLTVDFIRMLVSYWCHCNYIPRYTAQARLSPAGSKCPRKSREILHSRKLGWQLYNDKEPTRLLQHELMTRKLIICSAVQSIITMADVHNTRHHITSLCHSRDQITADWDECSHRLLSQLTAKTLLLSLPTMHIPQSWVMSCMAHADNWNESSVQSLPHRHIKEELPLLRKMLPHQQRGPDTAVSLRQTFLGIEQQLVSVHCCPNHRQD